MLKFYEISLETVCLENSELPFKSHENYKNSSEHAQYSVQDSVLDSVSL